MSISACRVPRSGSSLSRVPARGTDCGPVATVGQVRQSLPKAGRHYTDTGLKFSSPPRLLSDNLGPLPRTRGVVGFWPPNRTSIPWLDGSTTPTPAAMEILRVTSAQAAGAAGPLEASRGSGTIGGDTEARGGEQRAGQSALGSSSDRTLARGLPCRRLRRSCLRPHAASCNSGPGPGRRLG